MVVLDKLQEGREDGGGVARGPALHLAYMLAVIKTIQGKKVQHNSF
jgi:hypothetical protein